MFLGFLTLTWAARPVTPAKKAPVKKSTAKSTKSSAKSGAKSAPKSAARKGTGKNAPVRRTAAWRTRQLAPTPDRYRQIQQALAAKGYLRPEDATGVWNQTSTDAMKKFQAEQKIESSGKINSLSLIALGLGPRREPIAAKPPAAQ